MSFMNGEARAQPSAYGPVDPGSAPAGIELLEFVDTSVLVYAMDASAGGKHTVAERLLERLWQSRTGCLSVQVVQEFFVTVTRKLPQPLSVSQAAERIREFATWKVYAPKVSDVLAAISMQQESHIGFWDAMIVQAASRSGCDVLWSEDLNDGQVVQGVRIRNPFAMERG